MLLHLHPWTPAHLSRPERFIHGLTTHLTYSSLTSISMRIGSQERVYLRTAGCQGCRHGRCEPGCRTDLLRRLVIACAPGVAIRPAGDQFATRPYTRGVIAWPTARARMPHQDWLAAWDEARLQVSWACASQPRCVAFLMVGDAGPVPGSEFRNLGWLPIPANIPHRLIRVCSTGRFQFPLTRAWPGVVTLLFASTAAEQIHTESIRLPGSAAAQQNGIDKQAPDRDPAWEAPQEWTVQQALCTHLHTILDGHTPYAPATSLPDTLLHVPRMPVAMPSAASSRWPIGPGQGGAAMQPADIERWIVALVASEVGLTRRSVTHHLEERHKEHGLTLLCWLDRAGLLTPPSDPSQPYRYPRAFQTTDLELLPERLHAVPLPTDDDLRAMHG